MWSIHPLVCLSIGPSVHPSIWNQVVKFAKSSENIVVRMAKLVSFDYSFALIDHDHCLCFFMENSIAREWTSTVPTLSSYPINPPNLLLQGWLLIKTWKWFKWDGQIYMTKRMAIIIWMESSALWYFYYKCLVSVHNYAIFCWSSFMTRLIWCADIWQVSQKNYQTSNELSWIS